MKITVTMACAVFLVLALVLVGFPASAQSYAGAGTYTSGTGSQYAGTGTGGGFVGVGSQYTGTGTGGGVQTFTTGGGMMYSMTSVSADDVARLQSEGVKVVREPAGTTVYVTSQTGQPLNVNTGSGQVPNMIVFGPGGFMGVGAYAGPGTGAYAGAGGIGAGAGVGGIGAGAGASAGGGGISVGAGPGGSMQMYSFTGSPGQAFLITQQSGGTMDRVLVIFE